MRFYKVEALSEDDVSLGFCWYTRKADAQKAAKETGGEIEVIDVAPTKVGILIALTVHASHPDNG